MPPKPFTSAQSFALEQLGRVVAITPKRMFGGVGIYHDGLFFALLDDERCWLKVDDVTRPAYEARGLAPFRPFPDKPEVMSYYPVPDDVLEEPEALRPWVDGALDAARRARRGKAGRSR
jgi:DNA transformation protein